MKKKEKLNKKRLLQPVVSLEDLLDSPIFKKFNNCIDHIFDSAEEANFASMDKGSKICCILYNLTPEIDMYCAIGQNKICYILYKCMPGFDIYCTVGHSKSCYILYYTVIFSIVLYLELICIVQQVIVKLVIFCIMLNQN